MKKLNEQIRFKAIDDFTGEELNLKGKIVGFAKDIKKMSSVEFGELSDEEEVYLVKSIVAGEERGYHVVYEDEILKEAKKQHPDECDCVKCQARTEKGGLDYDPTNDNEEFEEHERQVFRDVGINKEAK